MVATVRNLTSASATSEYFRNEGGYYLEEGEGSEELKAKREEHREASAWHGNGAAALGLEPGKRVAAGKFEKLLKGFVLGTDLRLGRMRDGQHEHRPGFDITFSAPKSVSLAALLPTEKRPRGDRAVIRAHDEAVRATLDWVEETMLQTRGWDPATRTRPRVSAPSMVAATFRHIASRNLDPQLHTHAVIANVTRDANGRWKSVEPTLLHRNARLIGAYYRNELSRRLIERGYSVLPAMAGRVPSFELAGYGKELCEAFSTRRRDVLAYLEKKGLPYSTRSAQMAALASRKSKAEPMRAVLRRHWAERARELGFGAAAPVSRPREPISLAAVPSALEIVGRGMRHLEERQSVFAAGELEAFALAHSPGRHTIGEIREAVDWMVRDGHLVEAGLRRTDRAFVTDRALKAERATIDTMKAGIGEGVALAREEKVAAHLEGAGLTEGQEEAVRTILLARDKTVGVQGRAGTGKTTMLRQVRELAGGRPVVGLAPSAAAARVLERETGIHARTLQWFLTRCQGAAAEGGADGKLHELFGGSVLVLDEASMVSTDQMRQLMRIADGLGVARLVLVGDTRQLRAVDAGQPFRQLQQAGMTTATMDDILRQKNPALRQAVLAALAGEPREAAEMLGNGLVEVEHDELAEKAAETWLALDPEARDGTLLLAPTHALREEINRTVREALAEEGVLRGRTLRIERLVSLGMTRAERGDVRNYREDDEVVFNQDLVNYRLRKDEVLTVAGTDGDRVELLHPDGGVRHIRPAGSIRYRFDVYETHQIELRAGDRIRWTRNDRARALINGERAEVTEIARGRVRLRLEDGRAVSLKKDDPQLRHLDHAWSSTVHGAQGTTAEGVIAVLDSSHRALTDQSTFYVEISRPRRNAVVLTDNLEQLVEVLESNTGDRATAWEALGEEIEPETQTPVHRIREKAPVWSPRGEWEALEARARGEGTVLFLVEGYGSLIERTRLLAATPDLPAEIGEVADGLLAYDLACREHGRAAEEFLGLLEEHAGRRRGLEEAAEAGRCAMAALDGYPEWRETATRLAENGAALLDAADGRAAEAASGIARHLEDLRDILALDDAAHSFETLRIALDERAGAEATVPFYCDGYEELVERAREIVPLTQPDTYMRGAAEAVIDDHEACGKRLEEIGALREEAARCLEARKELEARGEGQPLTRLADHAGWSAECEAAAERWETMRDDPDTWRPHLDRRSKDAAHIAADMDRLDELLGLDRAWSGLLDARLAIADEARALGCEAFDLDRWGGFADDARALAEWPDAPAAVVEAARRVLEYDAVWSFSAGVREHGERRDALEEETGWRSEETPDVSVVDLPDYAPLSAFARELVQAGEAIRDDEQAYGRHLDRLPGGRDGFAAALERLDWHGPLDRFAAVEARIADTRESARDRGILVFHTDGYDAAMDDARKLAEERALQEEAARRRLQAEIDEQAARQAEWLQIALLLRVLEEIEKERRELERDAGREDVAPSRLPGWDVWNARHGEFADDARAALADETLAEHWTSRPEIRERIERAIEGVFENRTVTARGEVRHGEHEDRDEDLAVDPSLTEDYPVRCRRDLVVGDLLVWTETAAPDMLPGQPPPPGVPVREVRFEAELVGREAARDERDDRCTVEITRRSDEGVCGTAGVSFSMLAGSGCSRPLWDDEEERRREAEERWKELQKQREALQEQHLRELHQAMRMSMSMSL